MNASSALGKTHRARKTGDGAAEKQSVCQKRDKIQTAWQDVISEAKMSKQSSKARLPEKEKEGSNASTVLGNTRRAQKAADEVAEKQNVSQKWGKIQTEWQEVISEAKMTPKRLETQAFQRLKGRAYMPALY